MKGKPSLQSQTYNEGVTVKPKMLLGSVHRTRKVASEGKPGPHPGRATRDPREPTGHLAPLTLIWRRDTIPPAFVYLTPIS